MPVWLIWGLRVLVGVLGGALISLLTYLLTSSRGKKDAAAYKEKVTRGVEVLKKRVEDLEQTKEAAETVAKEAVENARVAEHKAAEAIEAADAHRAAAEQERQRADRAEQFVGELQERLKRVETMLARFESEAISADELCRILDAPRTIEGVVELSRIMAGSQLLAEHKLKLEIVLQALDQKIRQELADTEQETAVMQSLLSSATSSPKKS